MDINPYVLPASSARSRTLWPADAAADYLRFRLGRVLPLYVVAMAPFSIAMMLLIDVVTSEYRSMIGVTSWLLVFATVWRWVWLSALQRRVQADVRGEQPKSLAKRLAVILLLRLTSSAAGLWGSILIVPGLYGILLSGMTAPLSLEPAEGQWTQIKNVISWINKSQARLVKMLSAVFVLYVLAVVGGIVIARVVLQVLLPQFAGINATDVDFTLSSWTGMLSSAYFLFLIFDLYWAVLSVMVFYDLQSRRLAPDLRVRLRALTESHS